MVSVETMIWLFPVVFIIHDFEEIIMMPTWLAHNSEQLRRRFPRLATVLDRYPVSSPGFSLSVLLMFMPVALVAFLGADFQMYNLWAGAVLVFGLHFVAHCGQFVAFRGYVPAIITSVPGAIWCGAAIAMFWRQELLDFNRVLLCAAAVSVIAAIWLVLAHWVGRRFETWRQKSYPDTGAHR